ncbi:hypothetical protein C9374_000066 [Naegleria lovaniensis]|uniref:Cytochrome P450 n=1 Tax=Naegleria lovaniensis TaxID=51637 RepID=A0AA88GTJ9_NAELO|nr:uncharacterized protein C9374_000066 [Naegleria lovaniensis]KAG2388627.1 hypothetical protein C9374_000066 [Naegleria lovaniensis]
MTVTKEKCFKKNPETYHAFRTFGDNILSTSDHETWKMHHKICSPAFSSQNLQHLTELASQCFDEMVEKRWKLNHDLKGGFEMNMKDYSDLTLHILGLSVFGLNFGFFSPNSSDSIEPKHETPNGPFNKGVEFRKAIEIMFTRGVIVENFLKYAGFPLGYLYTPVSKWLGVEKAIQTVSDQLDEIISTRKHQILNKEEYNHQDLLSLMMEPSMNMELNDCEIPTQLRFEAIKSNAYIFSLAGHETTATALQWATYRIAKHKDIQEKIRQEVESVMALSSNSKSAISCQDYEKLIYTNAVLMETLRLHNPVPGVLKVATKDVTLGGFKIPKGTDVIISISAVCHAEKNWKNPLEFNPERFMESSESQIRFQHSFEWLSFMIGNRRCLGYKFALLEGCAILAKLVQTFEFELLNDESNPKDRIQRIPGITTRPGNLRVRAKLRS